MLVMKKILFGSVILVLLLIFFISYQGANNATVQTKNGPISGKTEAGVRIYLGIPFAAPPVGDLRWKPPQPVKSWKKVRDCTEFGPACPQPKARPNLGKTSEDCLYLNVWTPAKSADEKLAVMVFIHGGAFLVGAGSEKIYDPINIVKKGVVAVTINYRLGPFGFLAHPLLAKESPHGVSGNYGFIDQVAALKWVKQNIAAFGGNPNNVTIFGESAGALSIATHMISPLSKGLFHRAICESGAGFGHHYLFPKASGSMREALETGKQAEKLLGADTLGQCGLCRRMNCLRKLILIMDYLMKGWNFNWFMTAGLFLTIRRHFFLKENCMMCPSLSAPMLMKEVYFWMTQVKFQQKNIKPGLRIILVIERKRFLLFSLRKRMRK